MTRITLGNTTFDSSVNTVTTPFRSAKLYGWVTSVVLAKLCENRGSLVPMDAMLTAIENGRSESVTENNAYVYIRHIRQALQTVKSDWKISNTRGKGWTLSTPDETPTVLSRYDAVFPRT